MGDIKWIKLSTNMFEDEKIRLIEKMPESDTILIIWVKLLAQAGKTNASGYIYLNENIPYTEEMLATIFDRPVGTVRLALDTFRKFGMIDIDENDYIQVTNWSKHQNIEGMERVRKQTRERVKKHREKKKLEQKKDVTLHETLSNGTEVDKEVDKEKESTTTTREKNFERRLINKYLELRGQFFGKHSLMESENDRMAAKKIKDSGVEIKDALYWLEKSFENYKPSHANKSINSLEYSVGYILDRHHESKDKVVGINKNKRQSMGNIDWNSI